MDASHLKKVIKEAGITPDKLAEKLKIDETELGKWLEGERRDLPLMDMNVLVDWCAGQKLPLMEFPTKLRQVSQQKAPSQPSSEQQLVLSKKRVQADLDAMPTVTATTESECRQCCNPKLKTAHSCTRGSNPDPDP